MVQAEVDYGVARMYEMMHGGQIQVFRSLEEPQQFLGLPTGASGPPDEKA